MRAIINLLRCTSSNLRLRRQKGVLFHSATVSHSPEKDKILDKTPVRLVKEHIMPIFTGKPDRYGGITVLSKEEPCETLEFNMKLQESLKVWKEAKRRAIWFKVNLEQSEWVPVLAKNGFVYHHAKEDFVMMYKWISDEFCNVPSYAHTSIGVGAMVINDKSQVLVVKERYFFTPNWKLPGGYVEPGEDFVDAAMREVTEETCIKTEYVGIVALRHAHGDQFGLSNLYIVIQLKALTTDITMDERELVECQWMDIPEFMQHDHVHELNRMFVQKYLEYNKDNIKIERSDGIHTLLKKPYKVYSIAKL